MTVRRSYFHMEFAPRRNGIGLDLVGGLEAAEVGVQVAFEGFFVFVLYDDAGARESRA